ncbi:MAG: MotA/TolQ/ExbB proton channel family protein [Spirochaetales bacterium]|nr:MotA/TolQ/ExbB proton channel family protein [Spirochaetales bacterium]
MNEYLAWDKLIGAGGPTLLVLLVCSIVSFVVMIERWIYFRSTRKDVTGLVAEALRQSKAGKDLAVDGPLSYVLNELLSAEEADFEEVKSRAIAEKLPEMERYLNIEATLGAVSPFIGLLGTVVGIIRAFQSLGEVAGSSMAGLNQGIAEALIATAGGLFVAIPATIAYNYFRKRVEHLVLDMEIAASRLKIGMRRG